MTSRLHTKPIFTIEIKNASIADYEQMLLAHDWTYMYSDDSRYYERGRQEQMILRLVRTSLEDRGLGEEAKEIYERVTK